MLVPRGPVPSGVLSLVPGEPGPECVGGGEEGRISKASPTASAHRRASQLAVGVLSTFPRPAAHRALICSSPTYTSALSQGNGRPCCGAASLLLSHSGKPWPGFTGSQSYGFIAWHSVDPNICLWALGKRGLLPGQETPGVILVSQQPFCIPGADTADEPVGTHQEATAEGLPGGEDSLVTRWGLCQLPAAHHG